MPKTKRGSDEVSPTVNTCPPRQERPVIVVMLVVMATVIGIVLWQGTDRGHGDSLQKLSNEEKKQTWPIISGQLVLSQDLSMKIQDIYGVKLAGNLGTGHINASSATDCSIVSNTDVCLSWEGDRRLLINHTKQVVRRLNTELDCYDIEWSALKCTNQVFTDCYDVTSARWFGGYADKVQNWPFEMNNRSLSPYITNDSYMGEIGGVVERYFVSSSGIGIYVHQDVPMYFSLNSPVPGQMCFTGKYERYPYYNDGSRFPNLKYRVCQSGDVKSVHLGMSEMYIPRPQGIPDVKLFKYPIWSTWAQYHKDINQSTVLEFADNILKYNFTHAQLEIDDDWTPSYGDMDFNEQKFVNASEMVRILNSLGFRVTVWIHPFFNIESKSFMEAAAKFYLVREVDSPLPALVPWWDGNLAGILDVTNESAVNWFLGKLNYLKTTYNISSFKFDAGETSWLPHMYSVANMPIDPENIYPKQWVKLAALADTTFHQEVRAGYQTQSYPMFVRMMDKLSNWGHDNALKSIIPVVLTYGILGYPFVLPDMIGGNAYNNHPDSELYIRWLQLTTFLPSMQFSIVPWQYNDTIIEISQKFTKLHEDISETLIRAAKESVTSGVPIIRPLWWIAPNDTDALECEDEFLVGDEYLVAPVVNEGARSRDIYFPTGSWIDMLRGGFIENPGWVKGYAADISELAYFRKQKTG